MHIIYQGLRKNGILLLLSTVCYSSSYSRSPSGHVFFFLHADSLASGTLLFLGRRTSTYKHTKNMPKPAIRNLAAVRRTHKTNNFSCLMYRDRRKLMSPLSLRQWKLVVYDGRDSPGPPAAALTCCQKWALVQK